MGKGVKDTPYGEAYNTAADSVNGLRFVGRYGGYTDDDVKLTYFRSPELVEGWHRWYDSADGRWVSRDPIGEKGGVNLYSYVSQNPVNMKDVLGLCEEKHKRDAKSYFHKYNFCGKDWTAGRNFSEAEQNNRDFYQHLMYTLPVNKTDSCCRDHDLCAFRVRMGYEMNLTIYDCNIALIKCSKQANDEADGFVEKFTSNFIVDYFSNHPFEGDPNYYIREAY